MHTIEDQREGKEFYYEVLKVSMLRPLYIGDQGYDEWQGKVKTIYAKQSVKLQWCILGLEFHKRLVCCYIHCWESQSQSPFLPLGDDFELAKVF